MTPMAMLLSRSVLEILVQGSDLTALGGREGIFSPQSGIIGNYCLKGFLPSCGPKYEVGGWNELYYVNTQEAPGKLARQTDKTLRLDRQMDSVDMWWMRLDW